MEQSILVLVAQRYKSQSSLSLSYRCILDCFGPIRENQKAYVCHTGSLQHEPLVTTKGFLAKSLFHIYFLFWEPSRYPVLPSGGFRPIARRMHCILLDLANSEFCAVVFAVKVK